MHLAQKAKSTKARPALRLVDTKGLSRDDWLAVRKTGIGGSDAAAAVGLNPYQSQLELWLEKTGRDEGLVKPDPQDTTEPVYWGTLLEPIVAAAYTQQTGRRVRKVNALLRHPTVSFMLANLDREIVGVPDVQILECKTAGEFGARCGAKECPNTFNCRSSTSWPSPASRQRTWPCCCAARSCKSTGLSGTMH